MRDEIDAGRPAVPVDNSDPRLGDQRACMGCAQSIVTRLSLTHPKAGGNTLLAALDLWVQTFPPEMHPGIYRAISASMLGAAAIADGELAGVSIPAAQGNA